MNKTYLTILCAGILACGSTLASAKERMPEPAMPPAAHHVKDFKKHHENMENKLADELKLTKEQRSKAKELRQNSRKKIKPLMDQMKDIREKIDTIRKDNMAAFEKLLTPEQKAQFEKIKAERKPHPDKKKHRPLPPLPME